ncbi:MAG: glycoside hydrolase family 140 protein [Chitinophagaceae bacterium]|jgi:hypothetical protein
MIRSLLIFILSGLSFVSLAQPLQGLRVSDNGRYFRTADGKPFFWLGDTGWLLFSKCSRSDAQKYLDARKHQGFNVVQVMVLHEIFDANVYGDSALIRRDVSKPLITEGSDPKDAQAYDFWDHVDFIVLEAERRGIYIAMVPVWGSIVKAGHVSVAQGEALAEFLARRYGQRSNIIWLNGGDLRGNEGMPVWQAIGRTIRSIDPSHLMTFHPRGRYSSSDWYHQASWLDFNMFQSGHKSYAQDTNRNEIRHFGEDNWRYIEHDRGLTPVRPTLDGEPSYENIPYGLHDSLTPRWTAADLRRYAYWSVFAGGAGFTYGENSVMQFHHKGDADRNFGVQYNWEDVLDAPGAVQMKHLAKLMNEYNGFERRPAQELLAEDPGIRYEYIAATNGDGYAMFYTYTGRNFNVDLSKLDFKLARAWWFDPRTGRRQSLKLPGMKGVQTFDPPGDSMSGNDAVLILTR